MVWRRQGIGGDQGTDSRVSDGHPYAPAGDSVDPFGDRGPGPQLAQEVVSNRTQEGLGTPGSLCPERVPLFARERLRLPSPRDGGVVWSSWGAKKRTPSRLCSPITCSLRKFVEPDLVRVPATIAITSRLRT